MNPIDLLPIESVTHDGPTAVMRLAIALQGLPKDGGSIAARLYVHKVHGRVHHVRLDPLALYLTARVGAEVNIGNRWVTVSHEDWQYQERAPEWIEHFLCECEDGMHPLIEGEPSIGDVRAVDAFASLARS